MDKVRKLILARVDDLGTDLKTVSLAIGRNHAYMQQFIQRGVPRDVPEKVRAKLAAILKVSEIQLGAPVKDSVGTAVGDVVLVPMYDVQAAAGHAVVIDVESRIGHWPFPKTYLRQVTPANPNNLAMIRVVGDSMEPTLRADDWIMIDQNDKSLGTPGIFALHNGDGLVVKRVETVPGARPPVVLLISDNERHGRHHLPLSDVHVAGRVVWSGRKL